MKSDKYEYIKQWEERKTYINQISHEHSIGLNVAFDIFTVIIQIGMSSARKIELIQRVLASKLGIEAEVEWAKCSFEEQIAGR